VVSTAQYLTDLATELAKRGHAVTVVTGDRGYDDPTIRFPRRQTWNGINIVRIPSLAFGKQTKWRRALNFSSFLTCCAFRLLLLHRFDVVVALTSPPLISFLAALFVRLKGGRFYFWVMDLNPDEAVAAGWLKEDSFTANLLHRALKYSLKISAETIVLDRFTRDRLVRKGVDPGSVMIIPPWSHDDAVHYSSERREAFRARHNLLEKFVVMYAGNHSPCHPLDTLLESAHRLSGHSEFIFCFVGGGSERTKVMRFAAEHQLSSIKCLAYQPLNELAASLSAADLHTIVLGEEFVGIVHPCKIYNIMAVGAPFLYIGPDESHVTDIAQQAKGCQFYLTRHGDVEGVVASILDAARMEEKRRIRSPWEIHAVRFSKQALLPRMIRLIESGPLDEIGREALHIA
jgi:glycosyltransferase involved in cell wall biosynthesis